MLEFDNCKTEGGWIIKLMDFPKDSRIFLSEIEFYNCKFPSILIERKLLNLRERFNEIF